MGEIKDRMNPYSTELPLPPNYVSIACGMASFDSSTDSSIQDVSKRADEDMYQNKAKMKGLS
jgi:PleD family two-component response regulator